MWKILKMHIIHPVVTRSPSASTMRKHTPPRDEREQYGSGGGVNNDEGK